MAVRAVRFAYQKPRPRRRDVLAVLERLPNDCTIEDVQHQLYVTQAIGAGRVVPHELVDAELRRKWLVGSDK